MRGRVAGAKLVGMDLLDALPLPAALAILALLDGLSVGTLLIPLFLLIAPGRPRAGRILLYLGTITLFYLAVGVLCTLGLVNVIDVGRALLDSVAGQAALLVAGLALLGGGILLGAADARKQKTAAALARAGGTGAEPDRAGTPDAEPSGRVLRWRDRLLSASSGPGAVMGVALAAGVVEVAGMLPYLLGMTMLADAPIGMPSRFALLAGYCVVMVLPALVLLALRVAAARAVDRPLRRLAAWLQRTGAENTAWIMGIIGFLIARAAAGGLGIELPLVGS